MKRFQEFCFKFIAVLGGGIFLFLTYYTWRYTMRMHSSSEDLFIQKDSVLLSLAFVAAYTGVCAVISRLAEKIKERTLEVIAALVSVILLVLLFLIIRIPDVFYTAADQAQVYFGAESIYNGTIAEYKDYPYFNVYPFQLQVGSVFAVIFSLAGEASMQAVEYAHAICLALSVFAGFHITKELFHSKKISAVYLLTMITFTPMYIFVFFIYGDTLGTTFAIFSICFFLKAIRTASGKVMTALMWILCAMTMLIACMMRPAMMIAGIAMLIERILHCMHGKINIQPFLVVAVMGTYLIGRNLLFLPLESKTGIPLNGGSPSNLVFAMGLQDGDPAVNYGKGSYNGYNWVVFADKCNFDTEAASEIGRDYLKERAAYFISHPKEAVSFFKEKAINQWTEPSYGAFAMTRYMSSPPEWIRDLYSGKLHERVYGFMNLWQSAACFFLFLAFVFLFRKRDCPQAFLPGLILIGGFLFTLLWEAKSRYAYPYMVFSIPLISASVVFLLEKVTVWMKRPARY